MRFNKIETSAEVWAVIHARHPDMQIHGTLSQPDGDPFGNRSDCSMYTEYGLAGQDIPIIAALTQWTGVDGDSKRHNETHKFWLCAAIDEAE